MPSLLDLITRPTKSEVLDLLVALARMAGFPVASWQSGSVPRTLFEGEASYLSDVGQTVTSIAKGGLLKHVADAPDGWADLLAENVFDEVRLAAVFAEGDYTVTDAAGSGPHTISVGEFWVATADKSKRYVCSATPNGDTLAQNGTLTIKVKAESAGSAFNVANGTISELLTPFPGVTGSNTAISNGTWITTQGADQETTSELVVRCIAKWATLGSGSNDAAYRYWVTTASPEVKHTRIYEADGIVNVLIAGAAGALPQATVDAVSAYVEERRPLGVRKTLASATDRFLAIDGVLTLLAGYDGTVVLAQVQASLDTYFRGLDIGERAVLAGLIAAIKSVPGVYDVSLTNPTGNFEPLATEILRPSYGLTVAA